MEITKVFKPRYVLLVLAVIAVLVGGLSVMAAGGKWVTGDFHTHTFLTDGNNMQEEVVKNAFVSGLDWMANSEHGGTSQKDPKGKAYPAPVWRWITIKDASFPIIQSLRNNYPNKLLIQGLEWNVPSHEHASVGIVGTEPGPVSDFEYMFDGSDTDTSRAAENLAKINKVHADAVAGAKWLETNYPNTSYFLLNHPSRKLAYSVADIRDFIDAAPDVCFGMEGFPGHQKEKNRGGYGNDLGANTYKARTYGGADYMLAKVGGLWDALIGEGRHFWIFVNSDYHSSDNDFWPGEYAKNYTWVTGSDYNSLIDGLRSGNSFAVQGELINALDFNAAANNEQATMGQALDIAANSNLVITIRFKSPQYNNNGDAVKVDHIDLISGEVGAKELPSSPEYSKDTNETTKVIARFTAKDWKLQNGYYIIKYQIKNVGKNMYYRLRGTNLGLNVTNETDKDGNPLNDDLVGTNDRVKAYKDLWFYSNPIFVSVTK
ncbi:MAG TPA: hypothetical protein VF531_13065 [Bacillota bacterium]